MSFPAVLNVVDGAVDGSGFFLTASPTTGELLALSDLTEGIALRSALPALIPSPVQPLAIGALGIYSLYELMKDKIVTNPDASIAGSGGTAGLMQIMVSTESVPGDTVKKVPNDQPIPNVFLSQADTYRKDKEKFKEEAVRPYINQMVDNINKNAPKNGFSTLSVDASSSAVDDYVNSITDDAFPNIDTDLNTIIDSATIPTAGNTPINPTTDAPGGDVPVVLPPTVLNPTNPSTVPTSTASLSSDPCLCFDPLISSLSGLSGLSSLTELASLATILTALNTLLTASSSDILNALNSINTNLDGFGTKFTDISNKLVLINSGISTLKQNLTPSNLTTVLDSYFKSDSDSLNLASILVAISKAPMDLSSLEP